MNKSLEDISWNVPEEEYRADPALSYSILAKYERSGFSSIPHLFDKIETPSLTFGSMVDELITGSMESFNNRFVIAELPNISDSLVSIAKTLFNRYSDLYSSIEEFDEEILATVGKECDFYAGDKYRNYRVKLIKEGCHEYYRLMHLSKDKTIVTTKDFQDACDAVGALRSAESTKFYFAENNPFDGIERFYQLKFKATFNDVDYRIMADSIIVDHKNKLIYPCDLKTSGHPEWQFFESFITWNYQIQARLYYRTILDNLQKDAYFKEFKLMPYTFIVVNRKSLNPLTWVFEDTDKYGTLVYGEGKYRLRDPFDIGKELRVYLDYESNVPLGIELEESNSITKWLNKV